MYPSTLFKELLVPGNFIRRAVDHAGCTGWKLYDRNINPLAFFRDSAWQAPTIKDLTRPQKKYSDRHVISLKAVRKLHGKDFRKLYYKQHIKHIKATGHLPPFIKPTKKIKENGNAGKS